MSFPKNTGWPIMKITDVILNMTSGFSYAKTRLLESGIIQLRPYNITTIMAIDTSKLVYVSPNYKNIEKFFLKKGDILFNNTNSLELVGKTAFVENDYPVGYSNHITRIRVDTSIVEPRWFAYCLYRHWAGGTFERICKRWIGQAGINSAKLKSIEIPIPPLNIQHEILNNVEKIVKQIEILKKEKNSLVNEIETLLPSIVASVFLKAKKMGWSIAKLNEISLINMGQSPPGNSYNEKGLGVPLLNGPTEFGTVNPIPIQWTTKSKRQCKKDDILICVRGATTGKSNWADQTYCIGRGIASITPKKEKIIPEFLYEFLKIQTEIILARSGGKSTFPNLAKDQLKSLEIPLPEIPEQVKILNILNK
jgi:type I restriction enzyme S subunit